MRSTLTKDRPAFTLVELLVVIAIIGLLSTVAVISLGPARMKARDAKRLSDMKQILTALELYRDASGSYPANTDNDCVGWDMGYFGGPSSSDQFIQPLVDAGIMSKVPGDPLDGTCAGVNGAPGGYRYYRYNAGENGCDSARGPYFVLGILNMETSGGTYPTSPGWSCLPGRDWQSEVEWVTGGFEN